MIERAASPRVRPALMVVALVCASVVSTSAQWPRQPSTLARTADGRIDLTTPTPRTSDGRPDLSGVWEQYGEFEMPRYLLNIAADLEPDAVPLRPWARELFEQRRANQGAEHPGARCLPSGIPEKNAVPAPVKIVQTPNLTVFLYESRTIYRQIFTDGRSLPSPDAQPTWQGYSIGRWDNDTFVVETAGFNDQTWLDMSGHPATEALRVTERFTRKNVGEMELHVTIDDEKAYTRPWSVTQRLRLLPEDELIEHICEENNRAPAHIYGR